MQYKACAIKIGDNHTDIILQLYSNKIFLIITQYKKLGTLVNVSRSNPVNHFTSSDFSVGILFGVDHTHNLLAARFIAEAIAIDRPMLVAISLKDYHPKVLKAIAAALLKLKSW
ncbi:hypothetical protein KM043_016924 [Ampulex compressa]|nr:hypothetical protein KM043_016924 [Ampulex compressa]